MYSFHQGWRGKEITQDLQRILGAAKLDSTRIGSVSWRISICQDGYSCLLMKEEQTPVEVVELRDPWQHWSGVVTRSAGWTGLWSPVHGAAHLFRMGINLSREKNKAWEHRNSNALARPKLQKVWELNAPQNTEVEAGSGTHGCKHKVVLQSHPSQPGAPSCSVAPHLWWFQSSLVELEELRTKPTIRPKKSLLNRLFNVKQLWIILSNGAQSYS